MSTTVKKEGFHLAGGFAAPQRPHQSRPFSDGSMTVDTDILQSILAHSQAHSNANSHPSHSQTNNAIPSNFGFAQSLPSQTHPFDD
ncbi:hypothetical protein P7C73_g6464, partial [Tremellales sp. Uapishka_1]